MAIGTPINRGTDCQGYSTADLTFASFTPAANALLLAGFYQSDTASPPVGISGLDGGSSWVQLVTEQQSNRTFAVWGCFTGVSPSAGVVAIDINGSYESAAVLIEITGIDVSGAVANAIIQADSTIQYDEPTLILTTPSAMQVTIWGDDNSSNLTAVGTEINDSGQACTMVVMSEYDADGDASITALNATNGDIVAGWTAELKVASGASANPKGPLGLPLIGPLGGPI